MNVSSITKRVGLAGFLVATLWVISGSSAQAQGFGYGGGYGFGGNLGYGGGYAGSGFGGGGFGAYNPGFSNFGRSYNGFGGGFGGYRSIYNPTIYNRSAASFRRNLGSRNHRSLGSRNLGNLAAQNNRLNRSLYRSIRRGSRF